MKKLIAFFILLVLAVGFYLIYFQKNNDLKYVPENADFLVLIDTKEVAKQSIINYITNPKDWFSKSEKNSNSWLFKSGLAIPDYLQIFHLKNTKISEWYSILEIDDKGKLLHFLRNKGFVEKEKNVYQKDNMYLTLAHTKCLIGTSSNSFTALKRSFLLSKDDIYLQATDYINNTTGSFSYLSSDKIYNFGIQFSEDEIVITNNDEFRISPNLLGELTTTTTFLNLELDAKNLNFLDHYFNKKLLDSAKITGLKAVAHLESVKDTIISYEFDDNFNEVEKISFQQIIQPNYTISLKTLKPELAWNFFQNKNWINTENQFTAIPFQPNNVSKEGKQILINSTRKLSPAEKWKNANYIFIKNSELLMSALGKLKIVDKKITSNLDYLFYNNSGADYYFKIRFKKDLKLMDFN